MSKSITIDVVSEDALQFDTDVLALKYAQDFYGVDALIKEKLDQANRNVAFPPPWGFRLEESVPGIRANKLLFVGYPRFKASVVWFTKKSKNLKTH